MMRLFIAIEPPEKVKGELLGMRREITGVRWLAAEQLHLTLLFLGDQLEEVMQPLCQALARIRVAPFTLKLSNIGCFPHPRAPRILWIGLKEQPALQRLADAVKEAAASCSMTMEDRPYKPHITLARIKEPHKLISAIDYPPLPQGQFTVRHFILFASTLTRQGANHTPLKVFPLLAGNPPIPAK